MSRRKLGNCGFSIASMVTSTPVSVCLQGMFLMAQVASAAGEVLKTATVDLSDEEAVTRLCTPG